MSDTSGPPDLYAPYTDAVAEDDATAPILSGGAPEVVFGSLEEFVAEYLLPLYRRSVSGQASTWCSEWWRHPEAWVRLDALWRAWEFLRLQPTTGMSVWLRDHADFHMSVLLSANGPFRGCTPEQHTRRPVQALPTAPIPADAVDPTRPARGEP